VEAGLLLKGMEIPLGYGGRIINEIPSIRRSIWGHFLGEKLDDAFTSIEYILNYDLKIADPFPLQPDYVQALEGFDHNQASLEVLTRQKMANSELPAIMIVDYLKILSKNLRASLVLGNLDYLKHEFQNAEEWGSFHLLPAGWLKKILEAYAQVLYLETGQGLVLEWFQRAVKEMGSGYSGDGL
jgi:hypothetical protein